MPYINTLGVRIRVGIRVRVRVWGTVQQDKTKQDKRTTKTRQDKTRQDKTGEEKKRKDEHETRQNYQKANTAQHYYLSRREKTTTEQKT